MADRNTPGPWDAVVSRRREKIKAEVERNRRGDYTIPTWVMVIVLLAVVCGWIAIVAWG